MNRYEAGAEAMREAAAKVCADLAALEDKEVKSPFGAVAFGAAMSRNAHENADRTIRALPLPVDPASGEGADRFVRQASTAEAYQAVGAIGHAFDLGDNMYFIRLQDILAYGRTQDGKELLPFPATVDELGPNAVTARDAENATLRAALEKAAVYVERARLNLSYAKQDAVSSAAEAESNRNGAFHDCVAALSELQSAVSSQSAQEGGT